MPDHFVQGIIAAVMVLATAAIGSAATVDCSKGEKVGAAVAAVRPGETIVVRGACSENVTIPADAHGVMIEGEGDASIVGPDPRKAVILVLGREIGIRRLHLKHGRNGINILRGASAAVDGVTIEAAGQQLPIAGSGLGINIGQHAFASLVNSTIRNNRVAGILVHENSGARIGFVDVAAIVAGNTIEGNGRGMVIEEGAQARVVGTAIRANAGLGILVERGSHLEFADNAIEANGDDGVRIVGSSGAIVEIGNGAVRKPNHTSADKKNAGFGIACSLGGYVAGSLGSLTGQKGATNIAAGCANGLVP